MGGTGRLKKDREFRNVYRNGRLAVAENIIVYYWRNRMGSNRIGFSISKKVGKSVERHRIKRIYGEAFRSLQDELIQGLDLVIVARKSAKTVNFQQAREELYHICRKRKLLKSAT